jgi:hypothetical protein
MSEPATKGEALEFMKLASRDTFSLCEALALRLAEHIEEEGIEDVNTPDVLRDLACVFAELRDTP